MGYTSGTTPVGSPRVRFFPPTHERHEMSDTQSPPSEPLSSTAAATSKAWLEYRERVLAPQLAELLAASNEATAKLVEVVARVAFEAGRRGAQGEAAEMLKTIADKLDRLDVLLARVAPPPTDTTPPALRGLLVVLAELGIAATREWRGQVFSSTCVVEHPTHPIIKTKHQGEVPNALFITLLPDGRFLTTYGGVHNTQQSATSVREVVVEALGFVAVRHET